MTRRKPGPGRTTERALPASRTNPLAGLLLVDKEQGITSAGVVRRARRIAGGVRVGHAGSLDPLATGLLPLCLGPATRLIRFVGEGAKRYRATIRFGQATDTDDCTGRPVGEPGRAPAGEDLRRALPGFVGAIMQTPPRFSAKRVAGQRAYRLARSGKEVDLAPVRVRVGSLELLEYDGREAVVACEVGPGTYIRALARDLGERLGSGAHLAALRRLSVGRHQVEAAVRLETLRTGEELERALLPPIRVFDGWHRLELDRDAALRLGHGNPIPAAAGSEAGERRVAVLPGDAGRERLVAVVEAEKSHWRPVVVWQQSGKGV